MSIFVVFNIAGVIELIHEIKLCHLNVMYSSNTTAAIPFISSCKVPLNQLSDSKVCLW